MKSTITRTGCYNLAKMLGGSVFYAPYCDIQYLTTFLTEAGINRGVYGWNYTAYIFKGNVIVTGYRNLCGKKLVDCAHYDALGKEAHRKYTCTELENALDSILEEMIEKSKQG